MKNTLISESNMGEIDEALAIALNSSKSYQVTIALMDNSLRKRQRALANIWYSQIDKQQGNNIGVSEAYCKYHFGLKLACNYKPELESIVRRMLDGYSYEQKIEIIRTYPEFFPVLRDKGGLDAEGQALYLNAMQMHFAEHGVILTSPNEKDLLHCKAANGG